MGALPLCDGVKKDLNSTLGILIEKCTHDYVLKEAEPEDTLIWELPQTVPTGRAGHPQQHPGLGAGSFRILKQLPLTEDISIRKYPSQLQGQVYRLVTEFLYYHRNALSLLTSFNEKIKHSPVKYLLYSYDLDTCECPFRNVNKDSKCILKLIIERRVIKSVVKIYSDNYYSQNTHLYPNLHLSFFLHFKSS